MCIRDSIPADAPNPLGGLSFDEISKSVQHQITQLCEGSSIASLEELLEDLTRVTQASGIETSYHKMGSEVHLDRTTIHACLRICQEACQNAIKHSGATELRLLAVVASNLVTLTVLDNGVGCSTDEGNFTSIKERAQAISAELTIEPSEEGGMVLILTIPNISRAQPVSETTQTAELGQEIHDGICQELAVLIMMASHLRDETNESEPELWRNYRQAVQLCTEACDLARALSHRLMGR